MRVVSPWVARRVFLPAERALRVASEMRAAGERGCGDRHRCHCVVLRGRTRISLDHPGVSLVCLPRTALPLAPGDLPPDLELWAVANPLKDDPAWAEVKAEAGAVVLLTQPPLAWGPFEAWAAGIMKRGLHRDVRILGGEKFLSGTNATGMPRWCCCDMFVCDYVHSPSYVRRAAHRQLGGQHALLDNAVRRGGATGGRGAREGI